MRLSLTDNEIMEMDNVLPSRAAKYLDLSLPCLYYGLQQKAFPFGTAVLNPGGKYSYHISPGLLVAYKRGTLYQKGGVESEIIHSQR